jgi:hypothetical protein
MISRWNPLYILIVGGVLVVAGAVLPFLMVMKIIPSTYFTNFISYISSFVGLMAGIVGSALYVRNRRRKDRDK